MAPVDDALAVLRRGCYLGGELPTVEEVEAALATVRQALAAKDEELQRLREERDAGLRLTLTRIGHAPWCKCDICAPTRELLGGRP